MKKIVFGAVALVIISQLASTYYLNRRFQLKACGLMYVVCKQGCDQVFDQALANNQSRRDDIREARDRRLDNCVRDHAFDSEAQFRCENDVRLDADAQLARVDAVDAMAKKRRELCVQKCGTQLQECDASNAAAFASDSNSITATVNTAGTVTVDCIDGGPRAPCFKPVSDFCQHATAPCDGCTLSFCGGGEWTVDAGNQLPLNTTLVAATDPSKNPRVLATSTTRGNQAVLNVPADIKLGEGEQLYFGFSSTKKPGGPVEVRIQRSN
ncbi:MAG TPA: hypothetical protein VGO56_04310 [Pyrinomonadaceae bacterium]|jgi:hypothetical protein|nr:hypothetical protein [Pyrinomonadaceae bacterium]